jgi:hypothetical protein
MKKFIIILIIGLTAAMGCKKDPLDQTPSGRLDVNQVFNDVILTRNYLASIYVNLPSYFDQYFFYATLAPKSDEAADSDIGTEGWSSDKWNAGQLSVSFNPLFVNNDAAATNGFYAIDWNAIRKANVFLENIDNVPSMSEDEKRRLRGEAQALRAYFYFELIKFYGGVPIIKGTQSADFDFNTLKRNTYDECVKFIVEDCNAAAANLNDRVRRNNTELGRVTMSFALALKSRATLYNASALNNSTNDANKWKQAADAADDVLALARAGTFGLYNNYYEMFIKQDVGDNGFKEVIFQLPRNNGHFNNTNAIPFGKGFKAGTEPSQELVDSYPMRNGKLPILGYQDADHLQPIIDPASGYDPANPYANRDPRLTASIFYNGSVWGGLSSPRPHNVETFVGGVDEIRENSRSNTRTGYYIKKWINPDAGNGISSQAPSDAVAYWTIFRLAEFYLNYAEAQNEFAGPTQAVYDAVNEIRRRADIGALPIGLTKDEMRIYIRNERRVELAFEEHRFFDVRRWNILDKTDKLVTGTRITKNGNSVNYTRFVVEKRSAWQEKFLIFPIDISELSKLQGVIQSPNW